MPCRPPLILLATSALLAGCGPPDTQALRKLACQQVASSIDLQSVSQLDALRKALGVAPGVDPLQTCRDLGVPMDAGSGNGAEAGNDPASEREAPANGTGQPKQEESRGGGT